MRQDVDALLAPPSASNVNGMRAFLSIALLGALMIWLFGWYWGTAASIQSSWSRSETYQHGYLIVPISAWLIWRRREYLRQISPAPAFLPLLVLALLGAGWLLANLAEVVVVRQYALVLMVPAVVAAVMGYRFAWAMAFPLAFLVFAVPFGDFLIPPMMNFTADFTVGALQMTGIPVFREGNHFSLPSGEWSVVEACSGLRYLISAITLGCLYAYLTYRRWTYRLVFIALSVLVPILANGIRAYLVVMIGHLSSMRLAVGVDHLIYGWVFFGIVIMLLFWIGSFWREDTDPTPEEYVAARSAPASPAKLLLVTVLSAATIAIWPSYAMRLDGDFKLSAIHLDAPDVNGWRKTDQPISTWRPHYLAPRARLHQTFEKDGHTVGLFIGYYNHQTEDTKLISSLNALTVTEDKSWVTLDTKSMTLEQNTGAIDVHQSLLRGAGTRLTTWDWFWVAGRHTDNPYAAKLIQAKSRLLGHGDDSAVIVLYTVSRDRGEAAEAILRDFAQDAFPAIERTLNIAAGN